ncbi:hypothetical protein ANO11243_008740 [Dothideomycetidae sp. 11243]|nr:hypothetical protein ANO11243_008740 [fungal sp. No.11243]
MSDDQADEVRAPLIEPRQQQQQQPLVRGQEHGARAEQEQELRQRQQETRSGGEGAAAGHGDDEEHTEARQAGSLRATLLLVLTAGLSGLLFGYDTGIISSTLLYLPLSFPVSTAAKAAITSSTSLCALIASPLSAPLADTLGRRPVIMVSCALFVAGALIQALAPGVSMMVLGRSVVGFAIGAASAIVPLYISEIAPARSRGRLVTVQSLLITGGQVVAYLVGWMCRDRWRVAVGLGAVPALIQLALMGVLVESPRFLVMNGREEGARKVLSRLGGVDDVDVVVQRIGQEIKEEGGDAEDSWRRRWHELIKKGGNRRALTIACMLQGLQQLCGFNVLMYFSATIFSLVGFTSPVTTSLSIAVTNFLFTLFAFSLIDAIGRRRILLISIPFMVVGLALCAVCFAYLPPLTTSPPAKSALDDIPLPRSDFALRFSSLPTALLASLILYVAAYALGLGCVPWQQSELFPLRVRGLGAALATATNWSANFVVGVTFLPLIESLGSMPTFATYAFVCAVGWVAVWIMYPETAGLELEDVGRLLADGWGVEESLNTRMRTKGYVGAPVAEEDEGEVP